MYDLILVLVAVAAGSIASVAGFGIGSLLTPLLALKVDTKLAVALVSVPHLVGTMIRFFMLRKNIDKSVLLHFGILSAIGGLTGALLNAYFQSLALTIIFGVILIFAGFTGVTRLNEKFHFGNKTAWAAGALSGLLGGLVGNQGGIRSAALLGFNVSPTAFIATATAIGVIVDGARMPVYFISQGSQILEQNHFLLLASAGVIAGTFLGMFVLKRLPEQIFKRTVAGLILALGIFMFIKGLK
jgi:uncharacterized membrane protein YfcA